jgi:hypothetical protein
MNGTGSLEGVASELVSAEEEAKVAAAKAAAAVEAAAEAQARATSAASKLHSVSRCNARRKVEQQIDGARRRSSRLSGSPVGGQEEPTAFEKEEALKGTQAEKEVKHIPPYLASLRAITLACMLEPINQSHSPTTWKQP